MLRPVLSFFSMLAFGAIASTVLLTLMPSLSGSSASGGNGLQLESLLVGMMLGLLLGTFGRYNWVDVPRRVITWFLVRERQFFYLTIIALCGVVIFFY